jgi:serine/threonine protein kinase
MNATPMPQAGSATHKAFEAMRTTDLELTADLDDTHLPDPGEISSELDVSAPRPALASDDVPFHDEVPATPRAQRMPVAPGRILCDRFVLTKLLGTGGMCSVYLARDLEAEHARDLPQFVALKTPRAGYKDPARAVERLKREFEHAKRLSHTGIVQVFELLNEGDVWFMTMELLEGESVASALRRQSGPLAPYLIRRVLRGTADALAYAHVAGIAHGDLNPANIFVMPGERVKLLDFGAACTPDQPPSAAAAIAYASPQVLEGETPVIRDDVFSFGCIAYQVLTGKHPFEQRSAAAARTAGLRPTTPTDLTSEQSLALMAALSWDREARPDDVRTLATTLAPEAQRRRAPLEPEVFVPAPLPQNDTKWWLLAAVCVVAGIVAVAATRLA